MNICIDARWIFESLSGIGVHTRELIRALAMLDRDNQYRILFSDEALLQQAESELGYTSHDNWESALVSWSVFSPASQLKLPGWLKKNNIDVFHSTNYMMPFGAFPRGGRGAIKCVVTLHDLIPMLFRDHAPQSKKARMYPVYLQVMKQVAARADAIIAVSNASAKDVREQLQPAGEVVTIYNGISDRYQPNAAVPRSDTVLYVGRFDPYKNVPLLIEAFAELRSRTERPIRLQIIGKEDARYPEARLRADALDVQEAIDWVDYVTDEDLLKAYQSACMLVLPSDYEGFGLPVLEAMACGTPAICARSSSLPEVAGDVGHFFEPGDKAGLVTAMEEILQHGGPAEEALVAQAARFTWHQVAISTLELYCR